MHVTKVVDLFAKIPEQLSLHFSYFSTIFKRIYKFAIFQKRKEKGNGTLQLGPWKLKTNRREAPGRSWNRGGGGGCFPARRRLAGGGDGVQG